MERPQRVVELGTAHGAQIRPARQDQGVDVVVRGDGTDGDDGHADGVADQIRVRRLVAAAEVRPLMGDDFSGGHVDGVRSRVREGAAQAQGDHVGLADAAVGPVGGRYPDDQRLFGRPYDADRAQYFQGETHPVREAATVGISARVGQR